MCEKFKTCCIFYCFFYCCSVFPPSVFFSFKTTFFWSHTCCSASDWENFPADCGTRAESSSFPGLENIFMPLLQFSSPNTFFFICFRKVDANSSSLSCILHLGFFWIHCLKSQMWAITRLLSEQLPNARALMQILAWLIFSGSCSKFRNVYRNPSWWL